MDPLIQLNEMQSLLMEANENFASKLYDKLNGIDPEDLEKLKKINAIKDEMESHLSELHQFFQTNPILNRRNITANKKETDDNLHVLNDLYASKIRKLKEQIANSNKRLEEI